jgi:hypothetical protein
LKINKYIYFNKTLTIHLVVVCCLFVLWPCLLYNLQDNCIIVTLVLFINFLFFCSFHYSRQKKILHSFFFQAHKWEIQRTKKTHIHTHTKKKKSTIINNIVWRFGFFLRSMTSGFKYRTFIWWCWIITANTERTKIKGY